MPRLGSGQGPVDCGPGRISLDLPGGDRGGVRLLDPYPLIQTWRANTANSTSATSSQRKSSFRRMRLAAADAKVPYSAAAEMKGADQHGWLRPGFGHRVCGMVVAHGEA
jgi:hypothetical protein